MGDITYDTFVFHSVHAVNRTSEVSVQTCSRVQEGWEAVMS